ncbi:hypothetical protein VH569_13190 [Azospirillum sp. 11R-A]|uniref:AbiJ-NTD4 domain-containing protein n=1 Tax=Azospirillum sp. 11R-A TaxID=3111634 RepID=UPI003C204AE3
MSNKNYVDRHSMTFAQAEGEEPLPSPLKLKELSSSLRNELWSMIFVSIQRDKQTSGYNGNEYAGQKWSPILERLHLYHFNRPIDEYTNNLENWIPELKKICLKGDYIKVFGLFQFIIRTLKQNDQFINVIDSVLKKHKSAYFLVDGKTFFPISSDAEKSVVVSALDALSKSEYGGARSHIIKAIEEFESGDNAGAVREAIHAVEAVARSMEPSANTLAPALAKLEKTSRIHPALKAAFSCLYGYTSDEEGVRHALVENSSAQVETEEALFMIGACASFVTYLIAKGKIVSNSK